MKIAYRADFRPPAPALEVRLYSPITDRFVGPFLAIVNTGSDATLVPLQHLSALGAEETAPGWLIGITGDRQAVALYFIDIYLGPISSPGIQVIADRNGKDIVLGRDFLNRHPLFLDGPRGETTVLEDAVARRIRTMLS